MNKQSIDPAALAGTTLAVVLTIVINEGPFNLASIAVGITILLVLFAYDEVPSRMLRQRLAFAAVSAFATFIALGYFLERIIAGKSFEPNASASYISQPVTLGSWFVLFIIFVIIEHFRCRGEDA